MTPVYDVTGVIFICRNEVDKQSLVDNHTGAGYHKIQDD